MNPLVPYEQPIGKYAFHTTKQGNIDSIQQHGIKTTDSTNQDTDTIETVLTELGYDDPFPFDRTSVTYCHVDSHFVADLLPSQTDTDLFSDEITAVVVDIEKLTAPMYLADMAHASDLLDYHHAGEHIMLQSDTPDEAVEQYQNSITKIKTPDDIATSVAESIAHAELVIDGYIPSTAIEDIVV